MKKRIIPVLLAAMICASCNAVNTTTTENTAETTASAETTTTEEAATSEETTTAAETTAAEDTTASEPSDTFTIDYYGDTLSFSLSEGRTGVHEGCYDFDYAFAYPANGIYYDSIRNPELFDIEGFTFLGDETKPENPEAAKIKAGDTFGNAKIASASTTIAGWDDGAGGKIYGFMETSCELDGEYTFTGLLKFFYDEDYTIEAGDVIFIPDESIKGMPLPQAVPYSAYSLDTGVYCELFNGFRIGNILTEAESFGSVYNSEDGTVTNIAMEGAALEKLRAVIGDTNASCSKQVKVTLDKVNISLSDQFGLGRCTAKLVDIELV